MHQLVLLFLLIIVVLIFLLLLLRMMGWRILVVLFLLVLDKGVKHLGWHLNLELEVLEVLGNDLLRGKKMRGIYVGDGVRLTTLLTSCQRCLTWRHDGELLWEFNNKWGVLNPTVDAKWSAQPHGGWCCELEPKTPWVNSCGICYIVPWNRLWQSSYSKCLKNEQ